MQNESELKKKIAVLRWDLQFIKNESIKFQKEKELEMLQYSLSHHN